jgi:hypothetical protein
MFVAFHTSQLSERGTEVALYDYAHYNETILGNRSIVVTPAAPETCNPGVLARFRGRFEIVHYRDPVELEERELIPRGVDVFYCIKRGVPDALDIRKLKFCVHVIFREHQPHGDVYAYVSKWLARKMAGPDGLWVPHIVHRPASDQNLRDQLGIPADAIVFGRHGGPTTFNIPWVRRAVLKVARRRPDIHFVFLNTILKPPYWRGFPPNIHFLPATSDPLERSRFINTCDAMLHARRVGETFGLACAEFSAHNKPVITWAGSKCQAHIDMLGEAAIPYRNRGELTGILLKFRPDAARSWDVVTDAFSPQRVMQKFDEVFLSGNRGER